MMKFASLLLGSVVLALSAVTAPALTTTFSGNGANGFGGALGNGNLVVTSDTAANTFTFTLNPSGTFTNAVVIYVDSVNGGLNNTSTLTDNSTGSQFAISGYNAGSGTRTLATFASGFTADYAIAFSANDFTGLYQLVSGGANTFITGNGQNLSLTVSAANLGLTSAATGFKIEGTLISTTAYRSNETIGTSVTNLDPANTGTAPNAGFTGSVIYSASGTFGTPASAPEPGTYAYVGLGAVALIVLNRRRSRRA